MYRKSLPLDGGTESLSHGRAVTERAGGTGRPYTPIVGAP